MDHYVDIEIRPDPEFPAQQLMNALVSKLHSILVEQQRTDVGVSFPTCTERPRTLGGVLRLHGAKEALAAIMAAKWLGGMAQMVDASSVERVPLGATHRCVRRVQVKSSAERLRRRAIKRRGISEAEAVVQIPDSVSQRSPLPFADLVSKSTGQRFKLFVSQGPEKSSPEAGPFNAYGLSSAATVPWF